MSGVTNLEAGLVLLTHPLHGYFFRRDGSLGSYNIWHGRATPTTGKIREARYPLLERLGLVEEGQLDAVHSVLMQPATEFTIYLPPSPRRLLKFTLLTAAALPRAAAWQPTTP